jgi:serine/threonine protein kinase
MTGSRISHYELQSKLGQGGMGTVYRAIDTRLGRVVALKMIPRDALGRDPRPRGSPEAHASGSACRCHAESPERLRGIRRR